MAPRIVTSPSDMSPHLCPPRCPQAAPSGEREAAMPPALFPIARHVFLVSPGTVLSRRQHLGLRHATSSFHLAPARIRRKTDNELKQGITCNIRNSRGKVPAGSGPTLCTEVDTEAACGRRAGRTLPRSRREGSQPTYSCHTLRLGGGHATTLPSCQFFSVANFLYYDSSPV